MKRRLKKAIRLVRSRVAGRAQKLTPRQRGDQARARGDWTAASDLYRLHLVAEPKDFDIWVQLGHALKEIGRYDEAEQAYVAAGRLRERDADLWLMRGHLARLRGDEATAARHYAVSADIDGNLHATTERDRSRASALSSREPLRVAAPMARVVGAVERLEGGVLTGWALDPDRPETPPVVEAVVGNLVVAAAAADGPTEPEHSGARAFRLDLRGQLDFAEAPMLEVRLQRTGETLAGGVIEASIGSSLQAWTDRFKATGASGRARLRARATSETAGASVDILMFRPSVEDLRCALDDLANQFSPSWRLLIANDHGDEEMSLRLVEARERDPRVVGVEVEASSNDADRLRRMAGEGQGEWLLPLDAGTRLEPEAVFRLLDAAASDATLIFADVALYGQHPASLEGFTAAPAWSWSAPDAPVRRNGLIAFRRASVELWPASVPASLDAVTMFAVDVADKASAICHLPSLLARKPHPPHRPAEEQPRARNAGKLQVVVEVAAESDNLADLVACIRQDLGSMTPITLLDPRDRGACAETVMARLEGVRLVSGKRAAFAGQLNRLLKSETIHADTEPSTLVLIESCVTPVQGSLRRLVDRLHYSPAAVAAGIVVDDHERAEGSGFIVGPGGALAPAWRNRRVADIGLDGSRVHACSAAGFSMVAIRSSAFSALGGFDPDLSGLWRDIDFCLRLEHAGLGLIVDPMAQAKRVKAAAPPDKLQDRIMRQRWRSRLAEDDPYYSPLLSPALDHQPGLMDDPWTAVRISRRGASENRAPDASPRLTARPREVAA